MHNTLAVLWLPVGFPIGMLIAVFTLYWWAD